MSSWVASTPSVRKNIVDIIKKTELNAVVIDVKDNTGALIWKERMKEADLIAFLQELHENHIYVIGRVAVFQDNSFAKLHKDQMVQTEAGEVWKTKKGEMWVDPSSTIMHDYVVEVAEHAHNVGFDEINLDYIRFSTDGLNEKLIYPASGEKGKTARHEIIYGFYKEITSRLHEKGLVVSGDLFGIITTSTIDIPVLGQDLHDGLHYFDYIAPMVYPSHFAAGTFGFSNPNAHPSEVIHQSVSGALKIADEVASSTQMATSTIRAKLRPWYQDFDMGVKYDAAKVRAQIDAGEKLGIQSWMLWDPANTYTVGALKE
jgi:hypothetical protein